MQRILSAATLTAVGLTCKAYLNSGLCSISVRGLPYLLDALNSSERKHGQGVVTGETLGPISTTSATTEVVSHMRLLKSVTISRRAPFSLYFATVFHTGRAQRPTCIMLICGR